MNRLKIGVYSQAFGTDELGGGENAQLCIANVLAEIGNVTLLTHKKVLTREVASARFGVVLDGPVIEHISTPRVSWAKVRNPVRRLRMIRESDRSLSDGNDLFVVVAHSYPPFCFAKRGIVHALFPGDSPRKFAPDPPVGSGFVERLRRRVNRGYYGLEILRRLATYDRLTANSDYTAKWAQRRWGGRGWEAWYAPVGMVEGGVPELKGRDGIIVVGRFQGSGKKRQIEMVQWSRELAKAGGLSRLTLAGTASSEPGDIEYMERLREASIGSDIRIVANCSIAELHGEYRSARVFWHAMGYDVPEDHPEDCEHFGMTTVEAMSAGCVPIVINRGGQAEIVRHGVDGFRWSTPKELIEFTRLLLADDALWQKMSMAAIARAQDFSREKFRNRLLSTARQLCGIRTPNTSKTA